MINYAIITGEAWPIPQISFYALFLKNKYANFVVRKSHGLKMFNI